MSVFSSLEMEQAKECGRREAQVEHLRRALEQALGELTGRRPGGQRWRLLGASLIIRRALQESAPWVLKDGQCEFVHSRGGRCQKPAGHGLDHQYGSDGTL